MWFIVFGTRDPINPIGRVYALNSQHALELAKRQYRLFLHPMVEQEKES